jgi:hypothetical protein
MMMLRDIVDMSAVSAQSVPEAAPAENHVN